MINDRTYSTGQFMSLTHVTKKTLRYYDEHDILKPSYRTETGIRYYTDNDLAKMQQILLLKYLGFSLADIREMTINNANPNFIEASLIMQKKLIDDRIEQLQIVSKTLEDTAENLHNNKNVDWSHSLELIQSMGMEQSLKTQYQNSSNISSRINLHTLYSANKQGWFPWIYSQCHLKEELSILELGCGDGSFWLDNKDSVPYNVHIIVSDASAGMLRDARRNIGAADKRFKYRVINCEDIPCEDNSFDLIIANHVLFYCDDIKKACSEIKRVLKDDGTFVCSTYGKNHMKEISNLASGFDDRIVLSADKLYEKFGKENGNYILKEFFNDIDWIEYEDNLFVPDTDPIVSYIMSCHGNQTQYILDHYKEFHSYIHKSIGKGLNITKESGLFICHK